MLDPQDSAVLTGIRHDSRAPKRVVVLAAGTMAVATLSSIAPLPTMVTVASATSATPDAVTSDAATLDLTAAGAVAGTATTDAVTAASLGLAGAVVGHATVNAVAVAGSVTKASKPAAPAPKKRAAPVRKATVALTSTALAAPFAFGTAAYAQWHAKRLMTSSRYGWKSEAQFTCLVNLWTRESHWNYRSHNRSSGAHGIPQALPGSKMRVVASDWLTNPVTQIRWGLGYIQARYGSPCGAWAHFRSHRWY